jgi:hypothetical protein
MQHHYGPEAVDQTLRDLFKKEGEDIEDVPLFGGISRSCISPKICIWIAGVINLLNGS